jgi:hypothetical protein
MGLLRCVDSCDGPALSYSYPSGSVIAAVSFFTLEYSNLFFVDGVGVRSCFHGVYALFFYVILHCIPRFAISICSILLKVSWLAPVVWVSGVLVW